MIRKFLLLIVSLPFGLSTVAAGYDPQYWRVEYRPFSVRGTYIENKQSFLENNYCWTTIYGLNIPSSLATRYSSSMGINFRHMTAPGHIKGVYVIAESVRDSRVNTVINLGFEGSNHLEHQPLNFYLNFYLPLAQKENMFPFKFGMDSKCFARSPRLPSLWFGYGGYIFYKTDLTWTGGIGIEFKYILFKKLELKGKLGLDSTMPYFFETTISYSNFEHYNPDSFSIQSQLQSMPLERHFAPFKYFSPPTMPTYTCEDDAPPPPTGNNWYAPPLSKEELAIAKAGADIEDIFQDYLKMSVAEFSAKDAKERKRCYHNILMKLHPDKNSNDSSAANKLKLVNRYFSVLKGDGAHIELED